VRLAFSLMLVLAAACGLGAAACSARPAPAVAPGDAAGPAGQIPHAPEEGAGVAADVRGSCRWARPAGALETYRVRLRAQDTGLGVIRVRTTADFDDGDLANVMGEVPSGTLLFGQGPLKEADYSAGIGYAVVVRGHDNRLCRGYVSAGVVDVVAP
jgi:hypothetical protein